jgi:hypothetical protein
MKIRDLMVIALELVAKAGPTWMGILILLVFMTEQYRDRV